MWITGQLSQRVGPPPRGVRYPLWAWYNRGVVRRWSWGDEPDQVLIVFDAPDDQVLLSNSEAWDLVLMGSHLPASDRDDRQFEREIASRGIEWPRTNEVPDNDVSDPGFRKFTSSIGGSIARKKVNQS